VRLRVVGGVERIGVGDVLDEIGGAVVVAVVVDRAGLVAIALAVAVGVLGGVGDAVVVAVAIDEVEAAVVVAVGRRVAARFVGVRDAVVVGVEILGVGRAVLVVVAGALVDVEDAVAVAVEAAVWRLFRARTAGDQHAEHQGGMESHSPLDGTQHWRRLCALVRTT
jgi:hypothetical protein